MTRIVCRIAVAAAAATASAALCAGAAQAGDPKDQDGAPGESGTATATCRWMPPVQDAFIVQCTATRGAAGAGGSDVDY
ncbi:hypothetical protein ACU61A_34200 [Pseudonocardia sichuanensis]|uniref:hypothetical protein n=1 Tax=Pseudonocardia kunmingensis TaxID=630975 RepID=UPI001154E67B|nr:hypothetical protein [Pseudonocardia kunmingensis]